MADDLSLDFVLASLDQPHSSPNNERSLHDSPNDSDTASSEQHTAEAAEAGPTSSVVGALSTLDTSIETSSLETSESDVSYLIPNPQNDLSVQRAGDESSIDYTNINVSSKSISLTANKSNTTDEWVLKLGVDQPKPQLPTSTEADGTDGQSMGFRQKSIKPLTMHPEREEVRVVFNSGFSDNNEESTVTGWRQLGDDFGISGEVSLPLFLDEFASDLRSHTQTQLVLRDYQKEVAESALNGENDIILLPTGTGKTYIAIEIIIQHLINHDQGRQKVVFFATTNILALQQYQKIRDFMRNGWKCIKVTGDDGIEPEMLKEIIQGDEFSVIVVTPAIISNYFKLCKEARLSEFTLLIFDEYHHATGRHPYNDLIMCVLRACKDLKPGEMLPQMIGMTATIGIGDSQNSEQATNYVLEMCAKVSLQSKPSTVQDTSGFVNSPDEQYSQVDKLLVAECAVDPLFNFLQNNVMNKLETEITKRFASQELEDAKYSLKVEWPKDRLSHAYLLRIICMQKAGLDIRQVDGEKIHDDLTYCMKALKHLKLCYEALQLNDLLFGIHAIKHIENRFSITPEYRYEGMTDLYKDALDSDGKVRLDSMRYRNEKIQNLVTKLTQCFTEKENTTVIIFVKLRAIAVYLAALLNEENDMFRAKAFTSSKKLPEEGGTRAADQMEAREGFESGKYNILVATSVLEEGIDIQACNVVIRYMYIKDMISKIQSRGRARQSNAIMYTILNRRLADIESKNDFRESLMYKALRNIHDMELAVFQAWMAEHRARLDAVSSVSSLTSVLPPVATSRHQSEASVVCLDCDLHLGLQSHIRVYSGHLHIVLDGTVHEKVTVRPDSTFMKAFDGMTPFGKVYCRGKEEKCKNQVGVMVKIVGCHFVMWMRARNDKRGVAIKSGSSRTPLMKYQNIAPISKEQLNLLGPTSQYPTELLVLQ